MGQVAHLDNYVRTPECEVVALCDVRPRLLEAVAAKYRIPKIYTNDQEMLQDEEIDAIICCQLVTNTYPLSKEVLSHGKHLFTQAPMATCLEDATELADLADEKSLIYGVGYMKRYDIGIENARNELMRLYDTEELGLLLRVDAHCFGGDWTNEIRPPIEFTDEPRPPAPEPRYPDFLGEEHQPPYMEYLRIYTHNINLIRYLMPPGQLKFVDAVMSNRGGVVSHTTSFRLGDIPVSLRGTAAKAHAWQEGMVFVFEKGRITIKTPTPLRMQASAEFEIYTSNGLSGKSHTLYSPRLWSFMLQAAGFTGAVAGIGSLRAPGRDCLTDMALTEEIFKKGIMI
jgi:predicted dehydrogenase